MCLNYERSMKKRHTFGKVCRCISRAMVGVDVRIDLRGVEDAASYKTGGCGGGRAGPPRNFGKTAGFGIR